MAYNAFNKSYPDGSRSGALVVTDIKNNLLAMRDMIAANGVCTGFNASIGAGSNPEVTQWLYKKGAEWIKVDVTWTSGRVTKTAYYYSSNSGGVYDPMVDSDGYYVLNTAYDGSGFFSSSTWGATP